MAAILLVGMAAYPLLPVAPLPRVEFPTIQVTANLPSASPETMASTVAQPLERQFSQIAGASQVSIDGEQKRAIRVQVDPARLAAMGLTLEDMRQLLVSATVDAPKGTLDGARQAFAIYANDQLTRPRELNNVILAWRNGAPVRVRDIGTAVDGPENARLAGWQNNKRGIQLLIFKQPGANVIHTVERIRAALPKLRAAIPPSVTVETIVDRTVTIRASLHEVQFTLLLSIALVVMVIFLFLRNVWATVIPSITVPLALVGTFAVMFPCGYSLNNLTLVALTIAVGFVVDDAIVMLENIYRHIEDGMSPGDAALKGAGEIGFTIISISLSLIAVFIPLLLMGGIVGRLFREFAMTVAIAVTVSAVVSLTLTPMMCSRLLKHHSGQHGLLCRVVERFFDALLAGYRRTLDIALRFQFVTLMAFFATLACTVFLYIEIPKGLIQPQVIDDTLYDAFGQRQVAQYSTQVNTYKVILEAPPEMQGDMSTLDKLYVRARDGAAVPLSTFATLDTKPVAPLAISHQSQFPAVTLSFNLGPEAALGQAVDAIDAAMAQIGAPATLRGTFQGTAQAFQASLGTQPYLIAAALIAVYIILGVLYESFILPVAILSTLPPPGWARC